MIDGSSFPKGGRIEKYSIEFTNFLKRLINSDSFETTNFDNFMSRVFKDCQTFLKRKLRARFPDIRLVIIYNEDEYTELCKKIGVKKPYTRAMVVKLAGQIPSIYINFKDHSIVNPMNFIVDICSSFIEELIHIIDPKKSETQINNLVCSMLEGFLENKLPENFKRERLRIARELDGTS